MFDPEATGFRSPSYTQDFITAEMIDKGIVLKRSTELTERMAEAWLAALVTKVKEA